MLDKVQIFILSSISLDSLIFFMIASTLFSDIYLIDTYAISFRQASFSSVIDGENVQVEISMTLSNFKAEICRLKSKPICSSIDILNILGIIYFICIIVALITLIISCLNYTLTLLLRTRSYKFLNFSHYITAPLYLVGSLIYLLLLNGLSSDILIGFYIIIFANILNIVQFFLYMYMKRFNN